MAIKREEIKELLGEEIKNTEITSLLNFFNDRLKIELEAFDDYVKPDDHATVVNELTALKEAAAKQPQLQDYSKELAELENLRKFKTDTDTKELNGKQDAYILKQLEAANVHPNSLKLLLKQFDKGALEWTDKNEFKDFDKAIEAVKGEFPDHFGVEQVVGVKPGKAAKGAGGGYNADSMSMADWNALKEQDPQQYQNLLDQIGKKE